MSSRAPPPGVPIIASMCLIDALPPGLGWTSARTWRTVGTFFCSHMLPVTRMDPVARAGAAAADDDDGSAGSYSRSIAVARAGASATGARVVDADGGSSGLDPAARAGTTATNAAVVNASDGSAGSSASTIADPIASATPSCQAPGVRFIAPASARSVRCCFVCALHQAFRYCGCGAALFHERTHSVCICARRAASPPAELHLATFRRDRDAARTRRSPRESRWVGTGGAMRERRRVAEARGVASSAPESI